MVFLCKNSLSTCETLDLVEDFAYNCKGNHKKLKKASKEKQGGEGRKQEIF